MCLALDLRQDHFSKGFGCPQQRLPCDGNLNAEALATPRGPSSLGLSVYMARRYVPCINQEAVMLLSQGHRALCVWIISFLTQEDVLTGTRRRAH